MSFKKIVSIAVAWRTKEGDADGVIYEASDLGEGVTRQRAAQRVAIAEAAGHVVTDHRCTFSDGSSLSYL